MATAGSTEHLRERYLTLLKRALTHTLYWPLDIDWSNDHKKTDAVLTESVAEELAKPDFDWAQVRAEGGHVSELHCGFAIAEALQMCLGKA